MRRVLFPAGLAGLVVFAAIILVCPNEVISSNLVPGQVAFTANHGQWDARVLYRAEANGAVMWYTNEGVYTQFVQAEEEPSASQRFLSSEPSDLEPASSTLHTLTIRARFPGADLSRAEESGDQTGPIRNYFLGSDRARWQTHVPSYSQITYQSIYDGIDLTYYDNGHDIEFDFVVAPGADYRRIAMEFDGVESVSVDQDNHLVLRTQWGETKQLAPVVYQMDGNHREKISADYELTGGTVSFRLNDSYDPTRSLIIDPVLLYSAMAGGVADDYGWGVATRFDGHALVVGYSVSPEFLSDVGLNDYSGVEDAVLVEFDPAQTDPEWMTYLGGTSYENAYDIALDSEGNAYICGRTLSDDFPLANAYQPYSGAWDAFVTKIAPDGDSLV